MSPRFKKLIGLIFILVWLPIYAFIAMGIGVRVLPYANWAIALVYYALAGTLWTVPVGLLLPWMYREPISRRHS